MDAICPSVVDSLVRIWTKLHNDLQLEIEPAEARYLHDVMIGMDDELVARLLGVKLALARRPNGVRTRSDAARRGSEILYSVQGRHIRARLVHGIAEQDGRLGVGTRFGAALLGMPAGGSILWPLEHGRLVEVRLLEVSASTSAGRKDVPVRPQGGALCVSG
ncbi:MAG: hypothetical protein EOP62_09740 [Sphingomonadales bacterium]|nr:MAG: hypothetical protein EOP62_09740 [Sphingomonadales bacterium]